MAVQTGARAEERKNEGFHTPGGPKKFMMRFFSGCLGAIVESIVAAMATFWAATLLWGDWDSGVLVVPFAMCLGGLLGGVAGLRVLRWRRSEAWCASRPRRRALLTADLVLLPLILITGMARSIRERTRTPSDDAMLAHFQQHRGTLERIVRMAQTNPGLDRVDFDWTSPDDPQSVGVSPARIDEYRRLLDSAGMHRGFRTGVGVTPDEIDFFYWGQGSAVSSDTDKGFAYLPKPPAHTLQSLDRYGPNGGNNPVEAYRHITGHWYLYYDYLPG